MRLRFGLAALSNPHFDMALFPLRTLHKEYLPRYAAVFDTLELAQGRYLDEPDDRFDLWRSQAPEGFRFPIKLNKSVTEGLDLAAARAQVEAFGDLGGHAGPWLAQFPPSWQWSEAAAAWLADLLATVPRGAAVEFRHPSWFRDDVRDILANAGAALVWGTHPKAPAPPWATADFGYVRFVGRHYAPGARRAVMKEERTEDLLLMWERLADPPPAWRECTVIVTNTWEGNAIDSFPKVAAALGDRELARRLQRGPGEPLLATPPPASAPG